ncbi:self-pruning interacting protein 1 [Solanum lycopersicum]|uniref:Self-pruning interacting protein 1 n=1 Tax=Solanum lycopersicum TaxID=4081 RepID=Q9FR57_SOLLC|nr:self-pruning interacting protein 1 [Solanum lycopersicum]AAG43410.1 self-pruning interacting protein 1 [Solanum lycopersicum]
MAKDLQTPKDFQENQSPNINSLLPNECKTPKSPSFRIPKVVNCPGAPKKPKRANRSLCKRRLRFEVIVMVDEEEIDSFFRNAEDVNNGGSMIMKRRRSM